MITIIALLVLILVLAYEPARVLLLGLVILGLQLGFWALVAALAIGALAFLAGA